MLEQPMKASKFPFLTKFLKAQYGKRVTVFVVLSEDRYETTLGDGEFHYFREVFLTEEEAQRYIDHNRSGNEEFHLRTISIKLDQGVFVFPEFRPERYDHYKPEEVLIALEAHLPG